MRFMVNSFFSDASDTVQFLHTSSRLPGTFLQPTPDCLEDLFIALSTFPPFKPPGDASLERFDVEHCGGVIARLVPSPSHQRNFGATASLPR
jgi:hypothetical protein